MIGTAQRFLSGRSGATSQKAVTPARGVVRSSDAFVQSAADTASTVLRMCSFIIVFQVIISMLDSTGVNAALGSLTERLGCGGRGKILLPCVVEVTAGSMLSVSEGLPFTAFVAGFGGLSVHFQNFALLRTLRPKKTVYLLTRLIQGMLCCITVTLALRLPCFSSLTLPASACADVAVPLRFSRVSAGFGCAMLVMCLMSVICLPGEPPEKGAAFDSAPY